MSKMKKLTKMSSATQKRHCQTLYFKFSHGAPEVCLRIVVGQQEVVDDREIHHKPIGMGFKT